MTDDPSEFDSTRNPDPTTDPPPDESTDDLEPAGSSDESDGTDPNERDSGRSSDEPDSDADGDPSIGLSIVGYTLRLLVAGLVAVGRLLWTGLRIGSGLLTDTSSRREWRRWLLLEGDRRVIVGGFVAGVFTLALGLGVTDVIGVRESRFVTTMFSTMIAGLFSFIPIVVAVNQLIISRLFGTPDRLTERIDGVREFRSRVETQTEGDGVSPTDPASFLARLAGTLGSRADDLATECGGVVEGDGKNESDHATDDTRTLDDGRPTTAASPSTALESICRFAAYTRDHTQDLSARLTGETGSMFDVVLPTINYDYAGAANEARRLGRRFDEDLSERAAAMLEELRELFVTADATRQYFTTIYLQRELARLSRLITYSGTAAILLSSLVIMIYASGYPPVAFEGWLLVLVSLALAVAFSPLAVLFAYVVRVSTVLKRTSAPGAFTPSGAYHRTHATDELYASEGETETEREAETETETERTTRSSGSETETESEDD